MTFKCGKYNPNWKGGKPTITCVFCNTNFLGCIYRQSKYCSRKCCNNAKIGKPLDLSNRKILTGKFHHSWKGNKVSIDGLHKRVYTKRGIPKKCKHCKILNKKKNNRWIVHWANKSRTYKKDIYDFIPLCVSCHRKYDKSYFNLHPHLNIIIP